ncbi:helix-turn-helix domain-containing protein [Actinorugispora endophytica]|uniref:Helix-turn-helix protein n=1 Tax=Actinorugispora endophytica TaxID=1605990 RepID=A0A4R6V8E0_9ACTN|nr:helix-turn-helix transcriptional regulator [Actinorugispora endophytica]TDQ55409.1 helix-turn-helix protein [Actinorugispora endophytica]
MSKAMPVRRRHLIIQLRRLRNEAGLSQSDVSKEMGWDRQKILRIETGRFQRINSADVMALCRLYQASEEQGRKLVEIALQSRRSKEWWFRYKDLFPGHFIEFEAEATEIQDFTVGLIPGLFQTPDYIAALMERAADISEPEARNRTRARLERQDAIFNRSVPPSIWSVIDEAALRRQVGGAEVMRDQVRHLLELSKREYVNIQVIPFEAGAHAGGTIPFVILGFEGGTDSVVFFESPDDGQYVEDETGIKRHKLIYDRIQATALSVEDSAEFMACLL